MPSQALSDPRRERAANDALRAYPPDNRCPVCHAPLRPREAPMGRGTSGRKPTYCSTRCRMFAWRRNGDPDGRLDHARASKR